MLLIRDCRVLSETGAPAVADILISEGRIERIGGGLPADGCDVVDAHGALAIPGLVNAHLHSSEVLLRGAYDRVPFDAWGLYVYPHFRPGPLPKRLVYLRTALVAIESLRSGITCVVDDVADETLSIDALAEVFRAYEDVGIRANCSGNVMDVDPIGGLPYAEDIFPPSDLERLDAVAFPTPQQYRAFAEEAIERFHDPDGISRFVVAPVAPQWCSEEMLKTCAELTEAHELNVCVHVLETKEQAITSRSRGGGGFVGLLRRLGILRSGTTIAHGVWLGDRDLDQLAETGCAVAHNPIANQRLGVGIAPVRAMLERGIPVGLGTDGLAVNDRADLFEVMRHGVLLSRAVSPDPQDWLGSGEAIDCATRGGAQCAALGGDVGELRPGFKADLVLLRPQPASFFRERALNDVVFAGGPERVDTVVVDGRVVLRDSRPIQVDVGDIHAELAEYLPFLRDWQHDVEALNAGLLPYLEEVHTRCAATDIGYSRWAAASSNDHVGQDKERQP